MKKAPSAPTWLKILGLCPRWLWRAILYPVSWWLAMRPNRSVKRWIYNATIATGTTPSPATIRAAIGSWGRNLGESLTLNRWTPAEINRLITISDADVARLHALHTDSGLVIALSHLGNWDLAGAWACLNGLPVATVAEKLPDEVFAMFCRIRRDLGYRLYPHTQEGLISRLSSDLDDGYMVCLLADRDFSRNGVKVDWPTPSGPVEISIPPGPAVIAQRTGAHLVPAALNYEGQTMHITLGDEIRVLPGAEGVRRACEQMVDFYALSVRNHVVDWHMFQRFFPTGIHPDVTDRRR